MPPDNNRWLTIPNALSISRLLLLAPWWWLMQSGHTSWGAALIVYAFVSDIADGWIARRWNQASKWGRILDPVGDKVSALVVALFCLMHRDLPLSAFLATVIRDTALLIGGLVIMKKTQSPPPSVDIGRYAALLWGIVLLLYAFGIQPYANYALWPVVALYLLAGIVYARRAFLAGKG